jgi:hypothetical protein
MVQHWNKLAVAGQQVLALCTEELVRKFVSGGPKENYFELKEHGYPLSRVMCHFIEYFDTIEDELLISRLESYPEDAQFLNIFANGQISLYSGAEILDIAKRKYVGRFSIIAPLDELSWALVVHYENADMDGIVKFRFVEAKQGTFDRSQGLAKLLEIAENNGVGQPGIPYGDL